MNCRTLFIAATRTGCRTVENGRVIGDGVPIIVEVVSECTTRGFIENNFFQTAVPDAVDKAVCGITCSLL
jgi:hypothetical protein